LRGILLAAQNRGNAMVIALNGIGPKSPAERLSERELRAHINACRSRAWELLRQADECENKLRQLCPGARLVYGQKNYHVRAVVREPRYVMVKLADVQREVDAIILAVCHQQRVEMTIVLSKSRLQSVVMARAMIVWLVHEVLRVPFAEIGRQLIHRDHSTVIHGYRLIHCEMARRPEFRKRMEALREELNKDALHETSHTSPEVG
jgi:hypothetical protein